MLLGANKLALIEHDDCPRHHFVLFVPHTLEKNSRNSKRLWNVKPLNISDPFNCKFRTLVPLMHETDDK